MIGKEYKEYKKRIKKQKKQDFKEDIEIMYKNLMIALKNDKEWVVINRNIKNRNKIIPYFWLYKGSNLFNYELYKINKRLVRRITKLAKKYNIEIDED